MTLQSDTLVSKKLRLTLHVDYNTRVRRHLWDLVVFVEGCNRAYTCKLVLPSDPNVSERVRRKLVQRSAKEIIKQLKATGVIRERRWWDGAKDERDTTELEQEA
jgi:hypothetical protein